MDEEFGRRCLKGYEIDFLDRFIFLLGILIFNDGFVEIKNVFEKLVLDSYYFQKYFRLLWVILKIRDLRCVIIEQILDMDKKAIIDLSYSIIYISVECSY